jgi:hypothetical protein
MVKKNDVPAVSNEVKDEDAPAAPAGRRGGGDDDDASERDF